MVCEEYFLNQKRILKNLSEFTDDIIHGDGTLGPMPGSNADTADYPGDLDEHNRAVLGWEREDREASMKEAFSEGL